MVTEHWSQAVLALDSNELRRLNMFRAKTLRGFQIGLGLLPASTHHPIVLRGMLALVSVFSAWGESALFVHDYWSRQ